MEWTHTICEECWEKKNPERKPVQFKKASKETCCFCGEAHKSGIYVRHDPRELMFCKCKND